MSDLRDQIENILDFNGCLEHVVLQRDADYIVDKLMDCVITVLRKQSDDAVVLRFIEELEIESERRQ